VSGMECRRCGACCVAMSISSPIPGAPGGKPAGERCSHLGEDMLCGLYAGPLRPEVCGDFKPMPDTCGRSFEEAMTLISELEKRTGPG
jgi:Fe-S-cluster containining protein